MADHDRAGAETARLLDALAQAAQAWAAARPHDDGHTPTTCGVCPVCAGIARLSRHHPELLSHLGDAVTALAAAVACLADSSQQRPAGAAGDGSDHPDGQTRPADERRPTVQRIVVE